MCLRVCASSTDPVLFNHVPDFVRSRLAMWLPNGMAVLPNKLHGHAYFPFLKLLRSGQLIFLLNPLLSNEFKGYVW